MAIAITVDGRSAKKHDLRPRDTCTAIVYGEISPVITADHIRAAPDAVALRLPR